MSSEFSYTKAHHILGSWLRGFRRAITRPSSLMSQLQLTRRAYGQDRDTKYDEHATSKHIPTRHWQQKQLKEVKSHDRK